MRLVYAVVFAAISSLPAMAQDADSNNLREIETYVDAQGWEAVGRLNIGAGGMCTGTLIAPSLVLTAGHCAFDSRRGTRAEPSEIVFHAGWRNGKAAASRRVKRVIVHPDYKFTGPSGGPLEVSNDLALFELASDIRLANVQPFVTGSRPRKGQEVGVVSYAHDRSESASIEDSCHVLARQRGALVLSCDVDFGSSGAPVFSLVEDIPRIVSVVSAKAEVRGRRVSLGTNLLEPLGTLMAMYNNGAGQLATPEVNIISRTNSGRMTSSDSNAKFVRP